MGSGSFRLHAPRMVDFYDFRLFPVTRALGPALGIKQNSLLVGLLSDCTDRIRLAVMPLIWRHVFDATVAMLIVVPIYKAVHPSAHRKQVSKPL